MTDIHTLSSQIEDQYGAWILTATIAYDELTLEVKPDHLIDLCLKLRDQAEFDFNLLIDVCGVDYLHFGLDDWETESTTLRGFSRGVTTRLMREAQGKPARFAVIYHLLSLQHNHRIRLRVYVPDDSELMLDSVIAVWPAADWFEREAFDLYGILFKGHPDLRRLLTDYGFQGHPFRKDFPLIGKVESRYDGTLGRVIYEPVSITPRILEPKVIRHDNRYTADKKEEPFEKP